MVQLIAAQTVDRGDVVGYGTEYLGALANIIVNEENIPPCRNIKETIVTTLMNLSKYSDSQTKIPLKRKV